LATLASNSLAPSAQDPRRRRAAHQPACRAAIGWQFFSSEELDQAYVPFFGACGAAWDGPMIALER
jgi:hypothetical protein